MNGIVLMEITKSEGSITKMMTQEEAEKLLDEWVERLGLQDWEIHLAWKCEPKEIPLSDAGGCASYNEETKEATIYILDEQYAKCEPFVFDFERNLVHELLHLKTSLVTEKDENGYQARAMHQLVDDLAKAFVKAKRGTQKTNFIKPVTPSATDYDGINVE